MTEKLPAGVPLPPDEWFEEEGGPLQYQATTRAPRSDGFLICGQDVAIEASLLTRRAAKAFLGEYWLALGDGTFGPLPSREFALLRVIGDVVARRLSHRYQNWYVFFPGEEVTISVDSVNHVGGTTYDTGNPNCIRDFKEAYVEISVFVPSEVTNRAHYVLTERHRKKGRT